MSNFFVGPIRAFNAYHMDTNDLEDFAINVDENPDESPVVELSEDSVNEEQAQETSASGAQGAEGTQSGSTPSTEMSSNSSSGSDSNTSGNSSGDATNPVYDNYKTQMQGIYGSSLSSSSSILTAVKADISLVRKAYCNYDISDVEKTKAEIDSVMKHFYENFTNLNAEDSLTCLNKMLAALQYNKDHTDQWLKAHLVRNESGDGISDREINIKREEYDKYYSEIIEKFEFALSHINSAQAKDLATITSDRDIANLPTEYSDSIALLKKELGDNADDILNYKNCVDSETIAINNKKINAAISAILNDNYTKFFDGSVTTEEQAEAVVKQIRELNYILSIYNIPTNLSADQIATIQQSLSTFTSDPTDSNYYAAGLTKAGIDKDNINFQDEFPTELIDLLDKLSKTIGAGDEHVPTDSSVDSSGLVTPPSSPGIKDREKLKDEFMSMVSRSELGTVERATIFQRALQAFNSAQNLELNKAEEEWQIKYKKLQEELKTIKDEYENAISGFNDYYSETFSGGWSGETQGELHGSIENTIEFQQIVQKYENLISKKNDEIANEINKHNTNTAKLKSAFEYEVNDLVSYLSKLGLVATLNYNL